MANSAKVSRVYSRVAFCAVQNLTFLKERYGLCLLVFSMSPSSELLKLRVGLRAL